MTGLTPYRRRGMAERREPLPVAGTLSGDNDQEQLFNIVQPLLAEEGLYLIIFPSNS